MHIENIIIFNYRSCKFLDLELSKENPNVFIGLNDSGKSTVLQAFDLLLGNKPKYSSYGEGSYKSDLSNSLASIKQLNATLSSKNLPLFDFTDDSTLIIGKLVYSDDEVEKYTDLNLTTALKWSIECNPTNVLWIAKRYYNNRVQTYLISSEADEPLELWNATQATINGKIRELAVTNEDIENENRKGRFSNFEKIRAIYGKLNCSLKWVEYSFGKSDKDIFPSFNLFDWNTSLEEIISTANAIMQEEINEHITPIKQLASDSARKAEEAINQKFGAISSIIKEVAKEVEGISSKVHFDVKEKISDIMVTKTNSDGPIHLENQGEGLKRQIWFSLIKAKATSEEQGETKFIWAFDEPETHLYPGAQREFFDILNKISIGNVQTLISTHSTIFIDKSNLNKINSVKKENNGYTEINFCKDIDSIFLSLSVKNSDFLFYNKFLIVEGDTEQYLIPQLYELYTGKSLIADNIQLLNIQGKNKWNENKRIIDKVLGDFKKSEDQLIFLFDNDMSFEIGRGVITENMFFVGEQDIEDSIDDEVWLNILNDYYQGILEFNLEEINSWKESVAKNAKCNDYEKFYPILKKAIKLKCENSSIEYDSVKRIPSKGAESAEFLLKFMNTENTIPLKIKEAFNKLRV
ncbi:ATP-dependent nuclease [Pedobacter nanyangensis]|uniref:ATP-dependent nuclease n=1 Tax=Pedobacter nanyangensis TaxID=1562389 RepID=UPI000DE549A5|nr:AAA family ATPase [Pedobacter nanyangensis]